MLELYGAACAPAATAMWRPHSICVNRAYDFFHFVIKYLLLIITQPVALNFICLMLAGNQLLLTSSLSQWTLYISNSLHSLVGLIIQTSNRYKNIWKTEVASKNTAMYTIGF